MDNIFPPPLTPPTVNVGTITYLNTQGQEIMNTQPQDIQFTTETAATTLTGQVDLDGHLPTHYDAAELLENEAEAADDESFALAADDEKSVSKVAVLGNSPYFGANPEILSSAASEVAPPAQPVSANESNSQRKRRLANEHNAKINNNKFVIVKFRSFGLTMQLEILELTQRQVNVAKERGTFAVFTTKSATAAGAINQLPFMQHYNRTMINAVTLDWLIDQIGETEAFEIRSGRLRSQTPTKFKVEKSEAEWLAKGFAIVDGNVRFSGNYA